MRNRNLFVCASLTAIFIATPLHGLADGLPCEGVSATDDASTECGGSWAGTKTNGGGGSLSAQQSLAQNRCSQAATAGAAGCKKQGGTTTQISSCEAKVQATKQKCYQQAEATYGPGPDFGQAGDNTITGNTSDPFESAASAASAAVAAQASAAFAAEASAAAAKDLSSPKAPRQSQ